MAVFGIHLGNSSACLAVNKDGNFDVIANDLGDRVTPAVVSFHNNEWEIGNVAKIGQSRDKPVITNNKRLLNDELKQSELDIYMSAQGSKITNYDEKIFYDVPTPNNMDRLSPDHITSKLYGKMFSIASHAARTDGELEAVLAVPQYWSDMSCTRVTTAAELAGFTVLQTISEPAAALLAYEFGQDTEAEEFVLVYRLGGSSCDATLMRVAAGMYSVETYLHDPFLGGSCLTQVLADYIASEFFQKWKINPQEDRRARNKLFQHADHCKRVLSTLGSCHVFIESLCDGVDWSQVVTRARFENLINISVYMNPLQKLLTDETLKKQIKKIVLCGGTMKIPKLQSAISAFLPDAELLCSINPDEVIALGCARQAALFGGNVMSLEKTEETQCISDSIFINGPQKEVLLFAKGQPIHSESTISLEEPTDQASVIVYESLDNDRKTINLKSESPKLTIHGIITDDGVGIFLR